MGAAATVTAPWLLNSFHTFIDCQVPSARSRPPRPRQQPRRPALRCLHTPNPAAPPSQADPACHRLRCLAAEFRSLPSPLDRVKRLLTYAAALPAFPDSCRVPANRVAGCTAEVWLWVELDCGFVRFAADSDSEIAKGFCACLVAVLDGASPEEVMEMRTADFGDLDVLGSPVRAVHSRVNSWHNVLTSMQKRTKELAAADSEERPRAC